MLLAPKPSSGVSKPQSGFAPFLSFPFLLLLLEKEAEEGALKEPSMLNWINGNSWD